MKRCRVKVITNLDNIKEIHYFNAIKSDNVIKYIDFTKEKMLIDLDNNIFVRENDECRYIIDFKKNNIQIDVKSLKKMMNKGMKTLNIEKNKNSFLVKYQLIDENIINEYYIEYEKVDDYERN